jgi:hypothetical protein
MIKRNVTVTAKPNGGDNVTYEVGSVEDAIKHKEMLVGKVGDAEVFMPYGSLITAEVESETEEVDDPEDDACVETDAECSSIYLAYSTGNDIYEVGDGFTIDNQVEAIVVGIKGALAPGNVVIVKSVSAQDPSIVHCTIESDGSCAILALKGGSSSVDLTLVNGCKYSFVVTVND